MKITKLEHSGLMLEKGSDCILIDPVEFKEKLPVFKNVVATIITHKHDDHCQPAIISKLQAEYPNMPVFTTPDATPMLPGSIVVANETREVNGFKLQFFGESHAQIVEGQIPCKNLGVIVDDIFANPGDSFDVPPVPPKVLCVPISAPWAKATDAINYIKVVKPEIVIPVHDAVLSDMGKTYSNSWIKFACTPLNIQLQPLAPGASIEI